MGEKRMEGKLGMRFWPLESRFLYEFLELSGATNAGIRAQERLIEVAPENDNKAMGILCRYRPIQKSKTEDVESNGALKCRVPHRYCPYTPDGLCKNQHQEWKFNNKRGHFGCPFSIYKN
jgi:hypothetical protein